MLKSQGAQVIVAVTHLPFAEDRRLLERFPQIDLVIGGHEHFPITATTGRALVSKAGSDARFVARIDVTRRASGRVERFFQMIPVTADIPDEPRAAEVIATYETRLGVELDAVLGEITVPLNAEAVRLRASEQPIGNLVADMMRERVDADVAIVNSGSIRGDRVYPAGPVRRRALVAVHPFGNVICKVEVTGTVLLQALNSGVSKMPAAAGQFPQVSGLTMTVNLSAPAGNRVRDVKINGAPLDPAKRYTVAHSRLSAEGRRRVFDVRRDRRADRSGIRRPADYRTRRLHRREHAARAQSRGSNQRHPLRDSPARAIRVRVVVCWLIIRYARNASRTATTAPYVSGRLTSAFTSHQ